MIGDWNWERIVYENTDYNAIFEANKQRLLFGRAWNDFDVADGWF